MALGWGDFLRAKVKTVINVMAIAGAYSQSGE